MFVVAVAIGLTACGGGPDPTTSPAAFPPCVARGLISPGEMLPDCTFEGMEGQPPLRLHALVGKPAVINFWASWCSFCIKEMPGFQRVYESLDGRVEFVGMDVLNLQAETKPAAETFRRRTGVAYRLAFDPEGRLYSQFQPNLLRPVMPVTVFVDAKGAVQGRPHFGPLDEEELRSMLRERLGVS